MKKMNLYSLIGLALFSFAMKAHADEGVIRIPLNTFVKPAGDLMDQKKKILYYGDLANRFGKYKTLSDLSPVEGKYWQNRKFEAVDKDLYAKMPNLDETVVFDNYMGAVRELGIFSTIVRPEKNPGVTYGLTMGLQVHASLMKAALLRKAGFYQESPKYLHRIRVKFKSLDAMNEFMDKVFCENGPSETAIDCLSLDAVKRGFVSDKNDKDFSLVLHSVYMEHLSPEVPSLFDGLTPATSDDLPNYAQLRGFRALAIPFVMGDAGESLNRYSPQAVDIQSGWARMNFHDSVYFDLVTGHDDVKWALGLYAKLNDQDWNEIVEAGAFPSCTVPLVKSLLLHRFRNQMESFMGRDYAAQIVTDKQNASDKRIYIQPLRTINTSCVKEGKVTTEEIPGYPQRFSNGPRKSPFETADLLRYFKISTQSAVLQDGLDQLNKIALKQKEVQSKILGLQSSPDGISLLKESTSVFLGANANANRMITTGTFYGSQAPIQMVDSVTIGGGLGAQHVLNGLDGINRIFGASVSYARTFTHVVPLDLTGPLKQATQESWKNLLSESRLKKLAAPLKDGNLTPFLTNLKVGEVFTITDSLAAGGSLGWNSALDTIVGFVRGLSAEVSADASHLTVLRQVQISRTTEGLQIFVRDIDSHMVDADGKEKPGHKQSTDVYGVAFDLNYYINVLKLRSQISISDLHSDVFNIRYNSELMKAIDSGDITPDDDMQAQVDRLKELGPKASAALRALIFQSSLDPLYSNFKGQQFEIDHKLIIQENQRKFLWNHQVSLDQHHELKIQKTELPAEVNGGVVENKPIFLVIDRKGELRGRDLFSLGLESFNAWLSQKLHGNAPQYPSGGANPSMVPFGFAQWRIIRTDSEVTRDQREGGMPTVSIIEHTWGGWKMKRKQMEGILNDLKEEVKQVNVENFPILPADVLSNVDEVDFFKVNSHLSLLPSALDTVRDLVLAQEGKDLAVPKAKFVARLFQKISELGGKARGQDRAVYNNLMMLMGNGDERVGQDRYKQECEKNRVNGVGEQIENNQGTYAWSRGSGYECLAPWVEKLIGLSRSYPEKDILKQNRWMTEVLYVLDEKIPLAYMLNHLGRDKFLYYIELIGFRAGDEDGDRGYYMSPIFGEADKNAMYANGLLNVISSKTKISPVEFEKQGSF